MTDLENVMDDEKLDGGLSALTEVLEGGFDGYWALVRHGNPGLADDVFAESLARTAWDAATLAERDACAGLCDEAMRRRFSEADSPVRTAFGKDLAKAGASMAEELALNIRARSNAK